MKKFTAILLALVMMLSLATVAFATDDVNASTSTTNIQLKKLYVITGAKDVAETAEEGQDESKDIYPHETLQFVSTPVAGNPDMTMNLTIADWTVNGPNGTMSITLPNYTAVGKYVYTVKETAGNAQAAVYATGEIQLTVLVYYNEDHTALEAELYLTQEVADSDEQGKIQSSEEIESTNGVFKVDTYVNTYDVGHLDITKEVKGNLGSHTQQFEMTVTFKTETNKYVRSDITYVDGEEVKTIEAGWTGEKAVTINVKHGETVSFYNIPAGVTYTVVESTKHILSGELDPNSADDVQYTVEYDGKETGTIASNTTASTKVTNTKETSVDTGVVLDSMPYILMLMATGAGMFTILGKKRYEV